jgi:hypothetical protein
MAGFANLRFRQHALLYSISHSYSGVVRIGSVQAFFDGMPAFSVSFPPAPTVKML